MPSYLQEKEQLVPIKPYLAPTEAILNTYKTRLGIWGQGAAQLRSAYDSYKGLELTREDSQLEMSKLMQAAGQAMNAAAQTDLSVTDNRTQALTAFDPINNNQYIMGDHAYTVRSNRELAKADNARLKNNGKDFNQASYDAIQAQKELFRLAPKQITTADGSAVDSWKVFLSSQDKYNPYYDKVTEMQKLQDMFKTDITEYDQPDGTGRINTTRDASWYRDKWQAFVEANASPQLKNQLAIEARADYRKTLLANYSNPQAVAQSYGAIFEDLRRDKLDRMGTQLAEIDLRLQGLNKNSSDYAKVRNELMQARNTLIDESRKMNDPSRKENFVRQELGDLSQLSTNEAYVSALFQHKYFNDIGKAFTHKDVKVSTKMDGAYWALQNLNMRKLELEEDHKQFQSTMTFNYDKLAWDKEKTVAEMKQEKELALLKDSTDKLIAGWKVNAKGELEPLAAEEFTTQRTTPQAIGELGKQLYDTLNGVVSASYGRVYDTVLGEHFQSADFIRALGDEGDKPFKTITPTGGRGEAPRQQIADFLANTYWGSKTYANFGIDTSDPVAAKQKFKELIMNLPGSKIKEMLYSSLGNKRMFNLALESMKGTPAGARFSIEVEKADKELQGAINSVNDKYGSYVAAQLATTNYPKHVDPNSELYKLGIRGYEQDGKYRVPSKAELDAFEKVQFGKAAAKALPTVNAMTEDFWKWFKQPHQRALQSMSNPVDDWLKTKEGFQYRKYRIELLNAYRASNRDKNTFANNLIHNVTGYSGTTAASLEKLIHQAIGNKAAVEYNDKGGNYVITDKNKAATQTLLRAMVERVNDKTIGQEGADKLVEYIRNNPDAVTSFQIFSDGVSGSPYFTVTLDENKLNGKIKDAKDYNQIKIYTNSEAVPEQFRAVNNGYTNLITQPKEHEIDFMSAGKVKVSVWNSGDKQTPKFNFQAEAYAPLKDVNGNYAFDQDGVLMLERVPPNQFNRLISNAFGIPMEEALAKNPVGVYDYAVNRAYTLRDIIKLIKDNKIKNEKELVEKYGEYLEEFKKLK